LFNETNGGARRLKKRVLIVDDEAEIREIFATILEAQGFDVELAEDGRSALKQTAALKFDLIISDIRMPGMSGVELIKNLRESAEHLPRFLLMSGYADYSTKQLHEMGCDGFISKPFAVEDFLDKIRRVLDEAPVTPRRHARYPVGGASAIDRSPLSASPAEVMNISQGGLCVETEVGAVKIGDRVKVKVEIHDPVTMSLTAVAEVKWIRPSVGGQAKQGVGLEFIQLEPESQQRLQAAMLAFEKSRKN
jgi:DNA-binding response OmpR family regulator